jgi:hypothetical protein
MISPADIWDHVWHWRVRLPDRKGERCRVLVRGKRNTVLLEFEDGVLVTTSRHAVRRRKDQARSGAEPIPKPG